jgi:predicted dehydrogenase
LRVAVLGLGSAGSRHCRNLVELGAEPIAWDPDDSREVPDGTRRVSSAAEAFELAEAAIIASPSSHHAEQAIDAIDAGLPTLVEKPLATTAPDADRVATQAKERAVACGVAMNLRYFGTIMRARLWFGYDLRRWRTSQDYRDSYSAKAELGGGIVLDAIHELDYLCWLLGPAASVAATTGRVSSLEIDVEDSASAVIELASGAIATVDLDFVSPVYQRGCVLTGTEGIAEWSFTDETINVMATNGGRRIDAAGDVAATYRAEIEDFLRAVGNRSEPSVSAAEGAAAVRLADAIKASAAEGRRIELGPPRG